jgi:hypothetical protein
MTAIEPFASLFYGLVRKKLILLPCILCLVARDVLMAKAKSMSVRCMVCFLSEVFGEK